MNNRAQIESFPQWPNPELIQVQSPDRRPTVEMTMGFWSKLFNRHASADSETAIESGRILGYQFRDVKLLREALTHRSHANTAGTTLTYERLEFLGDSVLGLVVARHLFQVHPGFSEGELTKSKAALVNVKTLTKVAKREELGRHIRLSPEEDRAGGRKRASILSDVLEAIIGAIYTDGGIEEATRVIERVLIRRYGGKDSRLLNVNYKGELLEYLQGAGLGLPRYEVVKEVGPDHEKTFTVAVYADGRAVGHGTGSSKKDAEQQAARGALSVLCKDRLEPAQLG
jgi:ribonuclease-3